MSRVPANGGYEGRTPAPIHRSGNGWLRRIFTVPARSGEGPLTEPTTAAQLWRRERVLMPQRRPLPGPEDPSGRRGKQSIDHAASFLSHDGTTAETNRRRRAVVHD